MSERRRAADAQRSQSSQGDPRGRLGASSASAASAPSTAPRSSVGRGLDHGADRAERRRQDDALQPLTGFYRADGGDRDASTARDPRPAAARDRAARAWSAPSRSRGARGDDRARQHDARRARQPGEKLRNLIFRPGRLAARASARCGARRWSCSRSSTSTQLAGDYAGTLSGGQRKLLELARALMAEAALAAARRADGRASTRRSARRLLDHMQRLRAEERASPSCSSSTTWTS